MNGIRKSFPVQVALAALLVYGITLSTGVTLASLGLTAQTAGWEYLPMSNHPLFWLLTLPVRLLPTGWIPLVLNVFAAICAAATLGLMAATLELAAWDRPLSNLAGWRARLPLLLGLVVCGLEFHFWQSATRATGEALQILLLAGAIWSLFKYRVARDERWLYLASVIWGLGMVENWMMLITLPLFVVTMIWLGKMRILKVRVLLRITLAGLAGFALFAVLPTVNGLMHNGGETLGTAWWLALRSLKQIVFSTYFGMLRAQKIATVAVIIYFLLPVLPAVIRLHDGDTRNMAPLERNQRWLFRGLLAALLVMILWLAFDPAIGLRQILRQQSGLHVSLLSFDYLAGLSAAYLAGNLMLALDAETRGRRHKRSWLHSLGGLATPAVLIALVLATVGLVWRNLAAVNAPKRYPFDSFGAAILRDLPSSGGVMLSDEPLRLLSFNAAVAKQGKEHQWLPINTSLLEQPTYRDWLARKHADSWLVYSNDLNSVQMLEVLNRLSVSNRIYYLHPSLGIFFEAYYARPVGLALELHKFKNRSVNPPPLSPKVIRQTQNSWATAKPELHELIAADKAHKAERKGLSAWLRKGLFLKPIPEPQRLLLSRWYSVALDAWGVQLQQQGQLAAAGQKFKEALALAPQNMAARVNYQCNTNLLAGHPLNLGGVSWLDSHLSSPRQFSSFILANGPVDEPSFCYFVGSMLQKAGEQRQAIQQFQRAAELAPHQAASELALAGLYNSCGFPLKARQAAYRVRRQLPATFLATNTILDVQLSLIEAQSWLLTTNLTRTKAVLLATLKKHPHDQHTQIAILNALVKIGDLTNALAIVNQELTVTPKNEEKLLQKAALLAKLRRYRPSLAAIDQALAITNRPSTYLMRGSVLMQSGQFDQSEADFRRAEKNQQVSLPAKLGLATLALHRHDTNTALKYLTFCLSALPTNSPEHQIIDRKIRQLTSRPKTPAK